jgi:hypothetical protein
VSWAQTTGAEYNWSAQWTGRSPNKRMRSLRMGITRLTSGAL